MIGIFRQEIMSAGGIETWLYNLATQYGKTHAITLYYDRIAPEQYARLVKLIKCEKYTGQQVECDKAIFCFDFMGAENVTAKEYIHIVHADYKKINLRPVIPEKINKIYAVSKVAAESFRDVMGMECEVLYNPVNVSGFKKPLKLISATRLSSEKGLERMKMLSQALDAKGVDYEWDIYTPNEARIDSPNVVFRPSTCNILGRIVSADFLVQLSDTESYGYSVVEALSLGVPVIATNLPVLAELGITDKHGVIVDCTETDYVAVVDRILKFKPDFSYAAPGNDYVRIFGKSGNSGYKFSGYLVKNIYDDSLLLSKENVRLEVGEIFAVKSKKRLDELLASGYVVRI